MDGQANPIVTAALLGWFPATFALFMLLRPVRAVVAACVAGWLFLPVIEYKIAFLPAFDKTAIICFAVLPGLMIFDLERLLRFRPGWIDLPMAAVCLGPLASSLSNELGLRDGIVESIRETLLWGLPWLIGRICFTTREELRELAVGIFLGGLAYMPLCLYEVRMSPQLHYQVYGFHQHSFFQHIRYGGYRPMVFMQHGLMVGLFMASATLCGAWLYRSRSLRALFGLPLPVFVLPLLVTTILIKSVGAIVLLFFGLALLYAIRFLRSGLPLLVPAALAAAYLIIRVTGVISSDNLVTLADATLGAERAQSLQSRLVNEDMLTVRALERPVFGWGGWGRARIRDESGRDVTITDSLWIICLGNKGFLGLGGLMLVQLLPPLRLSRRLPVRQWDQPEGGAGAALAVVLLMWTVDNLLNAMINPLYLLVAGGLAMPSGKEPGEDEDTGSQGEETLAA